MKGRPMHQRKRILVIDDNRAIHDDFRKVFAMAEPVDDAELAAAEALLFDAPAPTTDSEWFEIDTAAQGVDGVAKVRQALAAGHPYALAFVDIRMPPGWDGVETVERLWQIDPTLQVVICSAYSDYTGSDIRKRLGYSDGLLILRKPFDPTEVAQVAHALTAKWKLQQAERQRAERLEAMVQTRTAELEVTNQRLAAEMREREQVESELRLAHKLEAIGQLAAGVAHEINTPIQYVSDNLCFVRDGMTGVLDLIVGMRSAAAGDERLRTHFDQLADAADLSYLDENVPDALMRMEEGVNQVSAIVRAMKELTHHGDREAVAIDINRALRNALEVTANHYKSVADLEVELGPLPPVRGYPGELGQVFINLIVNAAHAMEDRQGGGRWRGRLTITSRVDGAHVVVSVADTGTGIPEAIHHRIFDAFFTTKDVGRGTGQGLPIAHKIVVGMHAGALTFDTRVGVGTTFHVRLPIGGPVPATASAAPPAVSDRSGAG